MSALFDQLGEFSQRVFKRCFIEERSSPWSNDFKQEPKGVVLHYTGGTNPITTAKYFFRRRYQARVSAHLVVGRDWPDQLRGFADDLPLVSALPTMVLQCVPHDKAAWHARAYNDTHFGIEIVNRGFMPSEWESYPTTQCLTVLLLLGEYVKNYPIYPEQILGHEHVQKNKRDPGPYFPISEIRDLAFMPASMRIYTDILSTWDPKSAHSCTYYGFGQSEPILELQRRLVRSDPVAGMVALEFLGYFPVEKSIPIFQRMMGLDVDGVLGPKTSVALWTRIKQQGWLDVCRG